MGWFSSTKKETHTGFMGDLSEEQEAALEKFKKYIAEENLTNDPRYDDYYLLRFLRARQFDMEKTIKMFTDFLAWRTEHRADEAMVIYKCPNVEKAKNLYQHGYHGTDRLGRPFYIDQPCKFHIDDLLEIVEKAELYQYYVREYEKLLHIRMPACSAACGTRIEQSFSLLNIDGFTMGKLKEKSREFVKIATSIGQDNYPEIMGKTFIINAPFVFKGAWAIVKGFLDEKTRKKITILGSSYQKELFEHVDPENVPKELGGECTCPEHEKGCMFSDKGPWNEYPADEFGEAAKQAVLEEEKKEVLDQPPSIAAMPATKPPKTDTPEGMTEKELKEVNEQMDKLKMDPNMDAETTESLKVHPSDSGISDNFTYLLLTVNL